MRMDDFLRDNDHGDSHDNMRAGPVQSTASSREVNMSVPLAIIIK